MEKMSKSGEIGGEIQKKKNFEERNKLVQRYNKYISGLKPFELPNKNMKNVYESIINNKKLEGHINYDLEKRVKFIQVFPYENCPFNDDRAYGNILTSLKTPSCVYGYFRDKDNLKIVSFDSNNIEDGINFDQRCLLPENIFKRNFKYNQIIPPLEKDDLPTLIDKEKNI